MVIMHCCLGKASMVDESGIGNGVGAEVRCDFMRGNTILVKTG